MFDSLFTHAGLSLERLKAFAEIVQAGGITAAAGDDSNRQSQLSRQLKELEKHFGAELIKRGRGPMKLTAAGRQLHQIVNHAFSALADFQRNCTCQPVELHIGAGESLIQWLLLPQLARLATEHPRLNVTLENLRTEDILRQVADGSLDFGVVGRSDTNPDLDSAPLGRLDFGLFLPAGWLKPNKRGKSASTVLGQLPLAVLHGSAGIPNVLREEARKHNLQLDIRLRFSSYPQLAQAVQHMKVVAIMPTLAARSLPPEKVELVRLPFLDSLSRQLLLVWNKKVAEVRPAIGAYAGVLAGLFAQRDSKP